MKKRAFKLLICICVISCLMVGFCTSFASAATPVWLLRAKAAVAATMLASQLVLHPVDVVLNAPIASAVDPLGKIEWVETLPEYLDRSTIKIIENTAIIDGVEYSDVWLGPDAANALRLQGLDFATAYNIANNKSEAITYADGAGYFDGLPVYLVDGVYQSQALQYSNISGNYSFGDTGSVRIIDYADDKYNAGLTYNSVNYTPIGSTYNYDSTAPFKLSVRASSPYSSSFGYFWQSNGLSSWSPLSDPIGKPAFSRSSFSFDYTSGVIDAPIDPEDGLLVRVPTSYTDPQSGTVVYDIHDFTVNYPDISQPGGHEIELDPSLNPDFQTDIDLGNGLGDLLLTIFGLDLLNKIINFAPEPTTPEPGPQPGVIDPLPDPDPAPDEPVEGTTIANTDWTKLDELLRWIQSTIDSIRHITESLQTMLDSLFDQLQNLIQTLQNLPQQILEDIETGPSKVFRKALDILKSLFLPLILPIKAMMGLWHYVVEWIQCIKSPFTWIFGVMSGTSYNMVLPIYAVLAGSICIAIYKALGR